MFEFEKELKGEILLFELERAFITMVGDRKKSAGDNRSTYQAQKVGTYWETEQERGVCRGPTSSRGRSKHETMRGLEPLGLVVLSKKRKWLNSESMPPKQGLLRYYYVHESIIGVWLLWEISRAHMIKYSRFPALFQGSSPWLILWTTSVILWAAMPVPHRDSSFLQSLPPELITEIISLCPKSTVSILCRVSKFIYDVSFPVLYRHLEFSKSSLFLRCSRTLLASDIASKSVRWLIFSFEWVPS